LEILEKAEAVGGEVAPDIPERSTGINVADG